MKKIVEIKNLTKTYGRKGYESVVLKDVTMDIYEHDFIAIMGPSGAGKSTLLNLLSTLDKPSRGQIILDGEDVTRVGNRQLSVIRRDKIGFIFQEYNLLDNMTLQDNIALPLSLNGKKNREILEKVDKMADMFGLSAHLNKYPYQLSGGQKQRGASARALITEPRILFADEPTGSLDRKNSREIIDLLKLSNRNLEQTILLITHDEKIALEADRIIAIEDGRIVSDRKRG